MSEPEAPPRQDAGPTPLGQRFYDNIFLLLVLGIAIVTLVYTAWGLWEILTLPQATLP